MGWSKQLKVHSFPVRINAASWARGMAEGDFISKVRIEEL